MDQQWIISGAKQCSRHLNNYFLMGFWQIWDHFSIVMWQKYLSYSGLRIGFLWPETSFLAYPMISYLHWNSKMRVCEKWHLWPQKIQFWDHLTIDFLPHYYYKVVAEMPKFHRKVFVFLKNLIFFKAFIPLYFPLKPSNGGEITISGQTFYFFLQSLRNMLLHIVAIRWLTTKNVGFLGMPSPLPPRAPQNNFCLGS